MNDETNQVTASDNTPAEPKAKKAKKAKVGTYPFRSKREILAQVQADDAFALHCLTVLHALQTAPEQAAKATKGKNRQGFMSSHAVRGCTLAEKVNSGEEISDGDMSQIRELVSHYGRQLAAQERAQAIEANPELKRVAKVFSAA